MFEPPPEAALDALRAAAARGARMASICTGAFALAHAGLLDGRRATTHWFLAPELADDFPAIDVDPDALYVDEGDVLTSAGLSAGIDLCLHLVRSDHGERIGAAVARAMVAAAAPRRRPGAVHLSARCPAPSVDDGSLEPVRASGARPPRRGLGRRHASRRARVSPRTFARRFVAETGTTPLKWLHAQRVARGRAACSSTPTCRSSSRRAAPASARPIAARALPPRDRDRRRPAYRRARSAAAA